MAPILTTLLIRQLLSRLLEQYFPNIAALCKLCAEYWEAESQRPQKRSTKTFPPQEAVKIEFGYFFSMSINLDIHSRVFLIPHKDFKNFSLCLCFIFVFGKLHLLLTR